MVRICAIIPFYNEEKYAYDTINSVKRIKSINRIIAIDDGSKDNTLNIIEGIGGIDIIKHAKNMGKAESVEEALKISNADIYVFLDGDLGYSASNIEPLIDMVIGNECDACVARLPTMTGTGGFGLLKAFASFSVKFFTGVDFPCPLSGQRVINAKALKDFKGGRYRGYGLEVGMLIDLLNKGCFIKVKDADLSHRYTYVNASGFMHRTKQFYDIIITLLNILWRR
ncbi:MAG: glycosyltransferase [Clostridiales bacterium]|nr:glycosyltransferase [Clostridiales bacterium]HBM79869.1 glycosyl transferase [Clostridiaceae bacterium]